MQPSTFRSFASLAFLLLLTLPLGCGPAGGESPDALAAVGHGESLEGAAPDAAGPNWPQGSHLAAIKQRGELVMLSVPHQESTFVKTNLERGPMRRVGTAEHFEGVDVDIMSGFARRLGVELAIRPAIGEGGLPAYSALIPYLLRGEGDLIASSFSITDERQERIAFSDPYFSVYPAVVTRADSSIETIADLAGKTGSTVPGTSQERNLRAAGFTEDDLVYVEFQFENYTAVLDGEVDFTVQDSSSADRFIREYPELKIVGPLMDVREQYGFGLPPGSDLAGELNAYLGEIEAGGELERILSERQLALAD